ncbi:hypothetical protein F2Q70_00003259 [Brassica cretica]|uniref:Uncharacterized protein n=1 Tax=Brassica cretica TaxID=69181 RepID=A0A8S9IXF0_BRACR|nr:hypothetical protein F2Q70_00003259 [Brassica cretica]
MNILPAARDGRIVQSNWFYLLMFPLSSSLKARQEMSRQPFQGRPRGPRLLRGCSGESLPLSSLLLLLLVLLERLFLKVLLRDFLRGLTLGVPGKYGGIGLRLLPIPLPRLHRLAGSRLYRLTDRRTGGSPNWSVRAIRRRVSTQQAHILVYEGTQVRKVQHFFVPTLPCVLLPNRDFLGNKLRRFPFVGVQEPDTPKIRERITQPD